MALIIVLCVAYGGAARHPGICDYRDNRFDLQDTLVHSGSRALRALSVPRSGDLITTKSRIETELLHFVQHDSVWLSAWYYIDKGPPTTLLDLDSA